MGSRGRVPTSEVGVNIWNKGLTHPMYDCDNERILRAVSIFASSSSRALFFKHNHIWTILFSPNAHIHWREKHWERGPTKETQNFLLVLCRHASSRSRLAFQDFRKIREYPLLGFHPPLTIISLSTWETAHMGRILNGERGRNHYYIHEISMKSLDSFKMQLPFLVALGRPWSIHNHSPRKAVLCSYLGAPALHCACRPICQNEGGRMVWETISRPTLTLPPPAVCFFP